MLLLLYDYYYIIIIPQYAARSVSHANDLRMVDVGTLFNNGDPMVSGDDPISNFAWPPDRLRQTPRSLRNPAPSCASEIITGALLGTPYAEPLDGASAYGVNSSFSSLACPCRLFTFLRSTGTSYIQHCPTFLGTAAVLYGIYGIYGIFPVVHLSKTTVKRDT